MTIIVIVADNAVDQIVECPTVAAKERADLRAMGCTVRSKTFDNWEAANDWADRIGSRS